MLQEGYKVFPVHPDAAEIDGTPCFPSIADLPEPVDGLILCVPPARTEELVRDAVKHGIRNIWMQQGSDSPEAVNVCRDNGINEVHGECIMMFANPAGFHKFHRWLWKVIGKLPERGT